MLSQVHWFEDMGNKKQHKVFSPTVPLANSFSTAKMKKLQQSEQL